MTPARQAVFVIKNQHKVYMAHRNPKLQFFQKMVDIKNVYCQTGICHRGAFLFIGTWRRGDQTHKQTEIIEPSIWTNASPVKMLSNVHLFLFVQDRVEGVLNPEFCLPYTLPEQRRNEYCVILQLSGAPQNFPRIWEFRLTLGWQMWFPASKKDLVSLSQTIWDILSLLRRDPTFFYF